MATKQETFEWAEAFKVANGIRQRLEPHCENLMIVGSLRRQCETVHDIDIVILPATPGLLTDACVLLPPQTCSRLPPILGDAWQYTKGKSKIITGRFAGIPVDLYFATPDTWWTLVVIRTGSAGHNIRLCQRAKMIGTKLHADGSGLTDILGGHLCRPSSEEELFEWLQLPYVEPKDRS